MKVMVIFFTESEAGAPGYLSKKGEMSARTLSESLGIFLKESLMINTDKEHASRLELINEKIFKEHKDLRTSLRECQAFFKDILILSGTEATLKSTAKTLGEKLAIPISLSDKLNIVTDSSKNNKECIISKALPDIFNFMKEEAPLLKLLLLGVPLTNLKIFLKEKIKDPKKYESLLISLETATQKRSISAAFISGVQLHKDKEETWVFDI